MKGFLKTFLKRDETILYGRYTLALEASTITTRPKYRYIYKILAHFVNNFKVGKNF